MRKHVAALLAFLATASGAIVIGGMRTEYLTDPLGIDSPAPRFTWQISSDAASSRGLAQHRFRLEVREVGNSSEPVWSSLDVDSSLSHNITYGVGGTDAAPLRSGAAYTWTVSVVTSGGSATSAAARFSRSNL